MARYVNKDYLLRQFQNYDRIVASEKYASTSDLSNKQDTLRAGKNIKIEGNVISATGGSGGGGSSYVGQIPTMTGNTAPSGQASASSSLNNNYEAYKAFNNIDADVSTLQNGWLATQNDTAPWLKYQFESSVKFNKINIRTINNNTTQSKVFYIEGSTDDSTWVNVLASGRNVNIVFDNQEYTDHEILLNGSSYSYIRIRSEEILNGGSQYACCISKMQLYSEQDFVLEDLADVNISNPTNGQVLKYNNSIGQWINDIDASGISELKELDDVDISSPSDGQILKYNSTSEKWENEDNNGLDDLSNVEISSPVYNNSVLKYNSTNQKWTDSTYGLSDSYDGGGNCLNMLELTTGYDISNGEKVPHGINQWHNEYGLSWKIDASYNITIKGQYDGTHSDYPTYFFFPIYRVKLRYGMIYYLKANMSYSSNQDFGVACRYYNKYLEEYRTYINFGNNDSHGGLEIRCASDEHSEGEIIDDKDVMFIGFYVKDTSIDFNDSNINIYPELTGHYKKNKPTYTNLELTNKVYEFENNNLAQLNINISNPTNNQVLSFNSTNNRWENATASINAEALVFKGWIDDNVTTLNSITETGMYYFDYSHRVDTVNNDPNIGSPYILFVINIDDCIQQIAIHTVFANITMRQYSNNYGWSLWRTVNTYTDINSGDLNDYGYEYKNQNFSWMHSDNISNCPCSNGTMRVIYTGGRVIQEITNGESIWLRYQRIGSSWSNFFLFQGTEITS